MCTPLWSNKKCRLPYSFKRKQAFILLLSLAWWKFLLLCTCMHTLCTCMGRGGGAIPAPLPLPSLKSISRKLLHSDTSTYNFRLEKIIVNIQNILKSWVFKNSADHQKVFVWTNKGKFKLVCRHQGWKE